MTGQTRLAQYIPLVAEEEPTSEKVVPQTELPQAEPEQSQNVYRFLAPRATCRYATQPAMVHVWVLEEKGS